MKPWIVMRAHNDMPLVGATVARLREQSVRFFLLALDNASRDGTADVLRAHADQMVVVPEGSYVPGRVLNQGMALSQGEVVVFLNADCTPQHAEWLSHLLAPFAEPRVAAVFGRQIPRPGCDPLFAKDTEDMYGDGARHATWRHCFSMAASAIRRSVWEQMPFDESLRYSEDIDWSWRARQRGFRIQYAADAVAMHSHNYTLRQFYRRMYGEGCAEAAIFEWTAWERSWLRYTLLPHARQVVSDWRFCARSRVAKGILRAPVLRFVQAVGRRAGFRAGWRARRMPRGMPRGGEAPVHPVYARHATAAFNVWLDGALRDLATEVGDTLGETLTALVLGGGYGRGEGGVVRRDGAEAPYNDLDFTLVVRERRGLPLDALDAVRHRYERRLGIEVDFSRPLTVQDIRRWPPWLMWFDLLHGHIVLAGPPDILTAHAPRAVWDAPPLIEATRLLLNRGAGLLWARWIARGCEPAPDPDFVRRNYYKCALALGDAVLIAYRRFATPYAGREARLEAVAADVPGVRGLELGPLYRSALAFKFCPDDLPVLPPEDGSLIALADRWGRVFLTVEQLRTGRSWTALESYAAWRGVREPDQHTGQRLLRNVIRNGQRGVASWRYPRETLYRQLPHLLTTHGPTSSTWVEATARFLDIWRQFN